MVEIFWFHGTDIATESCCKWRYSTGGFSPSHTESKVDNFGNTLGLTPLSISAFCGDWSIMRRFSQKDPILLYETGGLRWLCFTFCTNSQPPMKQRISSPKLVKLSSIPTWWILEDRRLCFRYSRVGSFSRSSSLNRSGLPLGPFTMVPNPGFAT